MRFLSAQHKIVTIQETWPAFFPGCLNGALWADRLNLLFRCLVICAEGWVTCQVCAHSCPATSALLRCSQDGLIGSTAMHWTAAKLPHLSLDGKYSAGNDESCCRALAGGQRRRQPVFLGLRLTWAALMSLHLLVNEPESPERVIKHRLKTVWKVLIYSACWMKCTEGSAVAQINMLVFESRYYFSGGRWAKYTAHIWRARFDISQCAHWIAAARKHNSWVCLSSSWHIVLPTKDFPS